nr:protein,Ca binding [Bos taurus]
KQSPLEKYAAEKSIQKEIEKGFFKQLLVSVQKAGDKESLQPLFTLLKSGPEENLKESQNGPDLKSGPQNDLEEKGTDFVLFSLKQ